MWFTRSVDGMVGWFNAKDFSGFPRTGLNASDVTITVVSEDDSDSVNPSITESTQNSGTFYFQIPSAFLLTNGVGTYGVVVEINTTAAGGSGSPHIIDGFTKVLRVTVDDIDVVSRTVKPLLSLL
jgi:hypothetical protein